VKTATVLIVITPIGTETATNQVDTTTDGEVAVLYTPDIHTRNEIIDIMIEEVLVLRPLENPGSLHHDPPITPWTLLLLPV
jgi:hypothetical protein